MGAGRNRGQSERGDTQSGVGGLPKETRASMQSDMPTVLVTMKIVQSVSFGDDESFHHVCFELQSIQ